MGQIKDKNKYPLDLNISGQEFLVGSDSDENNRTRTYQLSTLADYFTQYFNSQNQSVSLSGEISGGNGAVVIPTVADASLIANKPVVNSLVDDDTFFYLANGELAQLRWELVKEYILDSGGTYVPPTYTPINISAGGLQFVRALKTNNLGHTIEASIGTIQDSGTTQKGVVREARPDEYYTNLTGVFIPPAAIKNLVGGGNVSGTTGTVAVFTNSTSVGNSIIKQRGETIGIGITPDQTGDTLQVAGYTLADGFKTLTNSESKVLSTDGGEVGAGADLTIQSGVVEITPLNLFTGEGTYQIPSTKNKLMYVNYNGTSATGPDSIRLPTNPIIGQRIYIVNTNISSVPVCQIFTRDNVYEFYPKVMFIFYWNGVKWISTQLTVNIDS